MQIFLPFKNVLEVAKCLDRRRLHKQIVECKQIIKAIKGETEAWKNHPIVKMYSKDLAFVQAYLDVLECYFYTTSKINEEVTEEQIERLNRYNTIANSWIPSFITQEYLDTMKGRLFIKDPIHYIQFSSYKEYGDKNMYFVNNEWKIYKQKK